MSSYCAGTYFL